MRRMYQVIRTYGEDEPWWFFDNWREMIVEENQYPSFNQALASFEKQYQQLCEAYSNRKEKPPFLIAFWNEGEVEFCEDCEDDLQLYAGLLLLKDGKKISIEDEEKDRNETIDYSGKTKCCKRSSACSRGDQKNENLY